MPPPAAPASPTVTLRHGATMPQLGLGTSPMKDRDAERAVVAAIETGYRLVDTAENYDNERGVGLGLRASGVPRDELFVTTKFNRKWHGVDRAAKALDASLGRLGLDYVDLLLIHWPNPQQDRYVEAWQGLVQLLEQGRVRAIGMSNFKPAHLERVVAETSVEPDVNQIQLSPLLARVAAREHHQAHGIVTQSWSPIGGGKNDVLQEALVKDLAQKYDKTPAQIVLRWHIELGLAPIPKSGNPERLRQNIDVFDFSLSTDDITAMSALDRGESAATDSDTAGH
ncbi:MAG TPA: aldo/keto reductase [Jiangellaceae bacterium]|nr:aldo/keto reductase [Jiangellaceae bacterium]